MKTTIEITVPEQIAPLLAATAKMFKKGLTIETLIESYLHDLGQVCHGSNGSDERMMAREYFLRCFETDPDGLLSAVFDELLEIQQAWYRFGNDKLDAYHDYEKHQIKALMAKIKSQKTDE